eukprot:tig00000655_g2852.t1
MAHQTALGFATYSPGASTGQADARLQALKDYAAWQQLHPVDKIKYYYPGVSMHPRERLNIAMPSRAFIGLFGRRGHGKSSFMDSCVHIFRGLFFQEFIRGGKSDESFTTKREDAEISQKVSLVDHPGLLNFGEEAIRTTLESVKEEENWVDKKIHKVVDKVQGKRNRFRIQAAIIFWDAETEDEPARMMPLINGLSGFLCGEKPIIVVTKIDKMPSAQARAALERVTAATGCQAFPIANYTVNSVSDDPKMNQQFCVILAAALASADRAAVKSWAARG